MKGSAVFDKDRKYRYSLKRIWDEGKGKVVFILLNPSLADEGKNDRTTARCISFAKRFGYGSLEIVDLFAYITPNYRELKSLDKSVAIGAENTIYLTRALNSADKIIAAWGENAIMHERHKEIEEFIAVYNVDCLGELNKSGFPRHPLYVRKDVELRPYNRPTRKMRRFLSIPPKETRKGKEGILMGDGKIVYDDSWMWCKSCLEDFSSNGTGLCYSCFETEMDKFKKFLRKEYDLSESSAGDYIGRFKGIVKRGLYNGEQQMTPSLRETIEKEYPKSRNNYVLALERYIDFQKKNKQ